jgi:hypothetical protein
MELRPKCFPPPLDAEQLARLTALAEEVLRAIDAGRPTRELTARFDADAGTKLTQFDFHTAASAGPLRDFVERVLTPAPDVRDLPEREAAELVRRMREGEGSTRERHYWLQILERVLSQPHVRELVYHAGQQLAPEDVVRIARSATGSALAQFIHPRHRAPVIARALLRRLVDARLLLLAPGAVVDDLLRGAAPLLDRPHLGPGDIRALAAWLVEQPTVDELFADDARIEKLLGQI